MRTLYKYVIVVSLVFLYNCDNRENEDNWYFSEYTGSYINMDYSEILLGNFTPGIYLENELDDDLKQMSYGRIEIDFTYNGGALNSFMPILYYGSINKNYDDDAVEETQFHLVVEIGHYNVVPVPLENLFYTICYDRYPLYCRDTYIPMISGKEYTFVMDKRPEGDIIHLKSDDEILNTFPSAFFPDSSQLFFKDVTSKINEIRGDSLNINMMLGKGFVGFDKGLHNFNGAVDQMRVYQYQTSLENSGYEIQNVKNQHFVKQKIQYSITDHLHGEENTLVLNYEFQPYKYMNGSIIPDGDIQHSQPIKMSNGESFTYHITSKNIGLYKVSIETIGEDQGKLNETSRPFEIWVYPEEWKFEY